MITTKAHSPVYLLGDDRETIGISEVISFDDSEPYRRQRLALDELAARYQEAQIHNDSEYPYLLSFLVLLAAEVEQRQMIKKMASAKLRGIRLGVSTVSIYLWDSLEPGWRKKKKWKGEEKVEKEEEFNRIVTEALGPIKEQLGMAAANPVALAYPVRDNVLARASTPDCELYLRTLAVDGPVYSYQLVRVCQEIREKYPTDAKAVIQALEDNKTREHLSALSLATKGRDSNVTMVNPSGRILTMQARKFEALIEHSGESKLLGVIGTKNYDLASTPVEFTTPVQKGEVIARYEKLSSILHVAALRESDREVGDTTAFLLDSDSVVCLYLAIRRQRLDRHRLEQLLYKAETLPEHDPFRHLN